MKNSLTLTVVANMTSNYSENLGNIGNVQKVFKKGKMYSIRSKESLKYAIMTQSGLYKDLKTQVDGAAQKFVDENCNVSNNRALEGGYMSTKGTTYVRNSSFYLTDAISCDEFINETRFHNNLGLATNRAKDLGITVQEGTGKKNEVGLMPYQYEYDKSLKVYSISIDLEMVGKDINFGEKEAENKEKAERVNLILDAVEKLSLVVRGNLDNAEPIFVVGGLCDRKTHYFENVVNVKNNKLNISEDLQNKLSKGYKAGLLKSGVLENEDEVSQKLNTINIDSFFDELKAEVNSYYGC